MKRLLIPMLLLLLAAQTGCMYAQKKGERGIKVKTKTPAAAPTLTDRPYDNMWAVVIGVNKYKHWDKLEYAVDDAKSVKNTLISDFGFRKDHVIELLDGDATLVNIRTTLGGVLPKKVEKNDGVVVFFAGHGATVDLPTGGNMGYLVPVEGSMDESEYFASLLPMTQVKEICSLIPAKHIFFVVDACYSGLAAASERGMAPETKTYVSKLASMRSRVILTAGGRGEPVIEKDEWGHSAFTYKFLDGLKSGAADSDNDGVITSFEIAQFIKSRVPKITGNRQTPQYKNLTSDEGEFVFISTKAMAAKSTTEARGVPLESPSKGDDAMRKELERMKEENERLRKENKTKDQNTNSRNDKQSDDPIFTPPP